jgi:hypothetical protein
MLDKNKKRPMRDAIILFGDCDLGYYRVQHNT